MSDRLLHKSVVILGPSQLDSPGNIPQDQWNVDKYSTDLGSPPVTQLGAADSTTADAARPVGEFRGLSTQTFSNRVARALVANILLDRFGPGDALPAAGDLASQFNVSRPVIREALKEVSTLGMVEMRQGRSTRVTDRSAWNDLAPLLLSVRLEVGALDDILADSLELRRVIETEAAALAAVRATPEDKTAMRQALEAMDGAFDDTDAYADHDVAFHDAILRATNNRLFLQLLEQTRDLLVLVRTVSATAQAERRRESQADHRAIFSAIEDHDADVAQEAMAAHLRWAESVNVEEYRARYPIQEPAAEKTVDQSPR